MHNFKWPLKRGAKNNTVLKISISERRKITTYLLSRECFQNFSIDQEDAEQEVAFALLSSNNDKEFWKNAYRGLYSLVSQKVFQINTDPSRWSEEEVLYAESIAAYYREFGWPQTADAFGIDPNNSYAQKLLSRHYGRKREVILSGKRPGNYEKILFEDLDKNQVSRTTYWRAKKRGYAYILKSKQQ